MAPPTTSTLRKPAFSDAFKPRRSEAIARLRNNSLVAVAFFTAAQLLPRVPSPFTCLWMLLRGGRNMGMGGWRQMACWFEIVVFGLLFLNIFQAWYALQYPPTPLQPLPSSPARRPQVSPTVSRRLKPLVSPSPSSPSSPFSTSQGQAGSPLTTPSRPLNYKSPSPFTSPPSHANSSLNTSYSNSFLSTPPQFGLSMSSPLASYGARHSSGFGRSIDGNLLSRLQAADDDDDD